MTSILTCNINPHHRQAFCDLAKEGLRTAAWTFIFSTPYFSIAENPLHGVLIGGCSFLSAKFVYWVCQKAHINPATTKVISITTGFFMGAALTSFLAYAVGSPITFLAALVLHVEVIKVVLCIVLLAATIIGAVRSIKLIIRLVLSLCFPINVLQPNPAVFHPVPRPALPRPRINNFNASFRHNLRLNPHPQFGDGYLLET